MAEAASQLNDRKLLLGTLLMAFLIAMVALGLGWAFTGIIGSVFSSVFARAFIVVVVAHAVVRISIEMWIFWSRMWKARRGRKIQ